MSKKTLINEEIKAAEARIIDQNGNQLGIMSVSSALARANDMGLDLVEIAPDSVPPVCKIMDYGKFRFEREKKEKEQRKKRVIIEIKEIQLKCNIDTHDLNTKLNHAAKFLSQGNKVKAVVRFAGREMTRTERGAELLKRFVDSLGDSCTVEKPPVLEGRNMMLILAPKKATSTKGTN